LVGLYPTNYLILRKLIKKRYYISLQLFVINTNSLVDSYALLTRSLCLKNIQLACVKLFASVHSEPGSNSSIQTIHDLLQ
jgi:hypothetical protein